MPRIGSTTMTEAADTGPETGAETQPGTDLCVLSVHAHPDDEASKGAATMARYASEGVRTVLVTCTGGEAGDVLNPAADSPETRSDLPAVRRRELDESVRIIGYGALYLLGYRDSGMADTEANAHPDNFANADLDEAVGRLVAIVRSERPQVLVGYARDRVYVHPDHLRVHEITVLGFERAGDPDWYPDAGEPWQPLKLYFTSGFTRRRITSMHEWFLEQGEESPFVKWIERMNAEADDVDAEAGIGDHDPTTTRIDVRGFLEVGRAASARAHDAGGARQLLLQDPDRGRTRATPVGGVLPRTLPRRHRTRRRRVRDRSLRRDPRRRQLLAFRLLPAASGRFPLLLVRQAPTVAAAGAFSQRQVAEIRGPADATFGTPCSQSSWHAPPITRRSPGPGARSRDAARASRAAGRRNGRRAPSVTTGRACRRALGAHGRRGTRRCHDRRGSS